MYIREYGSEFDWNANLPYQKQTVDRHPLQAQEIGRYRSGRDALKAIAESYKEHFDTVLLPALCCESMVTPFTLNGYRPVFYRLNADYSADIADVRAKISNTAILVYINYFGVPVATKNDLTTLKREYPSALFIEDRTHDLLERRQTGFAPDITIGSIRKWIDIPDGGLLWPAKAVTKNTAHETMFATKRKDAMICKSAYLQNGDATEKERFRLMLGEASELLDAHAHPFGMTDESASVLCGLDFDRILQIRRENTIALQAELSKAASNGAVTFMTAHPEKSTLYFPLLVEDQAGVQRALAQAGIYCPVIWPIPKEAQGVCPVAEYTAAHMLGVPCDQRYTTADMAFIAETICRIVGG